MYYDGISSSHSQKIPKIVFDFGFAYTKFGFAGETKPLAIIKSEVKCQKTGEIVKVFDTKDFGCMVDRLVNFLQIIFYRHLVVNSQKSKITIVENILGSKMRKKALTKALFLYLQVNSITFVPSHLVSLMTLGIDTALVIDVGYEEATVLPVYEGCLILKCWQAAPCAGKAIEDSLKQLLLERASFFNQNSKEEKLNADILTENIVEDIKVRCCFTTLFERKEQLAKNKLDRSVEPPPPPHSVKYPLVGSSYITVPGTVREMACESIFEYDLDFLSLAAIVLRALQNAPIDTKKSLASNIVIIGGTVHTSAFQQRLFQEMEHLVLLPEFNIFNGVEFNVHKLPCKANFAAWLGGSIIADTDSIEINSFSSKKYFDGAKIPDWTNENALKAPKTESTKVQEAGSRST